MKLANVFLPQTADVNWKWQNGKENLKQIYSHALLNPVKCLSKNVAQVNFRGSWDVQCGSTSSKTIEVKSCDENTTITYFM